MATSGERDEIPEQIPKLLWRHGDVWSDFTDEFRSQVVTVVTENGTLRVLDIDEGWQQRVPLPGRHSLHLDGNRHELATVAFASPCGIHTTSSAHQWHVSTPVIAVVTGDHPRWTTTPAGLALLEAPGAQRQMARPPDVSVSGHVLHEERDGTAVTGPVIR